MSFGEKTPKSELHEFFQLHPGSPTFDTQCKSTSPSDPIFVCKLKRPAIGALPAQTFTGEGRSKKMAEHNACKKALEVLRQHVFMAPAVVKMPEQQLPLDLEKQLASTHLVPLQDLQLKSTDSRARPTKIPSHCRPLPRQTHGVDGLESNGHAHEDYGSMEKDTLVTKLKQALKEIERLKDEVGHWQERWQLVRDFLSVQ